MPPRSVLHPQIPLCPPGQHTLPPPLPPPKTPGSQPCPTSVPAQNPSTHSVLAAGEHVRSDISSSRFHESSPQRPDRPSLCLAQLSFPLGLQGSPNHPQPREGSPCWGVAAACPRRAAAPQPLPLPPAGCLERGVCSLCLNHLFDAIPRLSHLPLPVPHWGLGLRGQLPLRTSGRQTRSHLSAHLNPHPPERPVSPAASLCPPLPAAGGSIQGLRQGGKGQASPSVGPQAPGLTVRRGSLWEDRTRVCLTVVILPP